MQQGQATKRMNDIQAGTNRSITLSDNAGHNAGQQAARGIENAGNRVNYATTTHIFAKEDNAHNLFFAWREKLSIFCYSR